MAQLRVLYLLGIFGLLGLLNMQSFILAGGFATRLWPLTEKRAKPLLPLAGKPIITHLVEKIPAGIPITVSTNAALKDGFDVWLKELHRSNVRIVVEHTRHDDEKLGALGATAEWIENESIEDDILLLTGDNYCGFLFDEFLSIVEPGTPILAAYDIGDRTKASHFGTVILASDGRTIAAFEEKPKEPKTSLVSTGCSILPKNALPIVVEYAKEKPDNVGGIFEEFLRRKMKVQCYVFRELWFDIGSFDAYLTATTTLVGENLLKAPSAQEHGNTYEGSVVIGARSRVENSTLQNVVLFEDCIINDCVLEDCVMDDGCTLQGIDLTGKMLRAGSLLKK